MVISFRRRGVWPLGARQSGVDAAVFKQIGDQVRQGPRRCPRIVVPVSIPTSMSHGFSFPLSILQTSRLFLIFQGGRDECPGLPVVRITADGFVIVGGAVLLGRRAAR